MSYENSKLYFTNPKSWVSWALIELHDYIMFFLINVLIVVLVYTYFSLMYYKNNYDNKKVLAFFVHLNIKRFNHAPFLEFLWTFIPIILLFMMGWPSFKILYAVEQLIDPYHTVIIVGNQWYWTYQYSDFDVVSDILVQLDDSEKLSMFKTLMFDEALIKKHNIEKSEFLRKFDDKKFLQFTGKSLRRYGDESKIMFDSVILSEDNLPFGYPRMLSTDQVLVLPSGISVRLLVTSVDVIHSWAMPAFGYKMDAIPGRLNQIAFIVPFWGSYWGQCSELCGINHGFMPIEVRVLPFCDYLDFIKLNFSFKFDLFYPLLQKVFLKYVDYQCYYINKEKYSGVLGLLFLNDISFPNDFIFDCLNSFEYSIYG